MNGQEEGVKRKTKANFPKAIIEAVRGWLEILQRGRKTKGGDFSLVASGLLF